MHPEDVVITRNLPAQVLAELRDLYNSDHPNITAFHGAAYDQKVRTQVCRADFSTQRERET
jgi:hypothetical protein